MSIRDIAAMDQASSELVNTQPALWWGLYSKCISEGYNEKQAMQLVVTFINGFWQSMSGK